MSTHSGHTPTVCLSLWVWGKVSSQKLQKLAGTNAATGLDKLFHDCPSLLHLLWAEAHGVHGHLDWCGWERKHPSLILQEKFRGGVGVAEGTPAEMESHRGVAGVH